jgi:cold shock CspA family protein
MTAGTVKLFNESKGYGFIESEDGKIVLFIFLKFKERDSKLSTKIRV